MDGRRAFATDHSTFLRGWELTEKSVGPVACLTADVNREPVLARRLFDRFEPVHAVTYFAPEARGALGALGYRGFWTGYFAARSAPLGQVPPEVVTAMFYNFSPARVAKALPAAWDIASPAHALRIREASAATALRRYGLDDATVRTAAELAGRAARHAPLDGRPLFAANRALPWPTDPVAALWHAATLLREHRGDAHVAVLLAAGITGRESNVLHSAAGAVPEEFIRRSRHYDDIEWRDCCLALARRGLLAEDGTLTADGRELKDRIETATDTLALTALDGLTDAEIETLFGALTPITRAVVAAGDVPAATPMGLRRDDLDDANAHL
jgi:Helix-turn-helix family